MHWPELHQLFNSNVDELTSEERRMNVINNPHLVDWFFTKRVEEFTKEWLYNCLDAEWHWYRYEYQARGSIHCHGIAKLKSDPGLCDLTDKALKGFIAETYFDNNTSYFDNTSVIDGKKASQQVCQYVDSLMSTWNPCSPDAEIWIKPKVHPCKQKHECVTDVDDDYVNLLNTVQRHTRCSTKYCLRYKQGFKDMQCRFSYPFALCPQTKLVFEPVHKNDYKSSQFKAKIVTKRNDARLNNHQQIQLQGWRANCDIQVVIDQYACTQYLTKYAAKGEPKSAMLTETFGSVLKHTDKDSDAQKTMKKIAMRTLGQRDFSAQETMHLLLSLKLYSTSFNVIPVNLHGSRRINSNQQNELAPCTKDSILDVYAKCLKHIKDFPDVIQVSLMEFIEKYKLVKGKLIHQSPYIVPRAFPNYSSNPKGKFYSSYCKYQLLKYKPWANNPNNAWDSEQPCDQTYIDAWHDFLTSPEAALHVPNWEQKLHNAMQNAKKEQSEDTDMVENETHQEEWMVLASFHSNDVNDASSSNIDSFDWQCHANRYTAQQIGEMPSWITAKRETFVQNKQTFCTNTESFSYEQRLAYTIVTTHSLQDKPLHLIINGEAGTGKSYLINALCNHLQDRCKVTATTGKAAYAINGITIHSFLRLPVTQVSQRLNASIDNYTGKTETGRFHYYR